MYPRESLEPSAMKLSQSYYPNCGAQAHLCFTYWWFDALRCYFKSYKNRNCHTYFEKQMLLNNRVLVNLL